MSIFSGEADLGHPYWWEAITWPRLNRATLPDQLDLLVIGAGYAGLSGAIAAHDAGAKVAVIEAGEPGQGASTRNGGMMGAHPRLGWETLKKRFGEETADALFAEAAPALNWVCDLIAREEIDCDLEKTGRIQLAYTPGQFANQKQLVPLMAAKTKVACHLVTKSDLPSEIKTDLYQGGLIFDDHHAVHPAKYHQGLLTAVLRRSIPVVSQCPAEALIREGAGFCVQTPKGEIRAGRVQLATNGYTKSPFSWFARRVFPLPSFIIATEQLSSNLIGDLAPGRRMMVETRSRHSYFRISPDGSRILFGGRAAIAPLDLPTAARRLATTMHEIWPQLEGVKLSHVWTGNTGYSFDHMPMVGERDGVHFALGFSGSGTVMAPYLGAKAALRAIGAAGGETAYAQTRLTPRWFHPMQKPYFLHGADLWYRNVVDRQENWAAR